MGVKNNSQSKRDRTKYTTEQLYALERSFCISQYPDTATMEDLADTCNVSVDKISTWFQNRRSKFKRQSKDTNISWMRNHVFNKDMSAPVTRTKSNLNYTPSSSLNYMPPPTPFYPPVVPYDMFNDILRDINTSTDSLPSTSNTSSPTQYHSDSPLQTSSPKTQPDLLATHSSPLQENCSLVHGSPMNQSASPDSSYVLNSSSDSSLSCQQTTSPPSSHHAPLPYSQQDVQGCYMNQALSWHYFQTSVAQCMYRR